MLHVVVRLAVGHKYCEKSDDAGLAGHCGVFIIPVLHKSAMSKAVVGEKTGNFSK